ncbi:MAG: ribose-phosphate diphosphokinase [Halobacteriota archaeon]|nr:ribose-phosphate diphosphokinase [Halobacteriota archaeon]
MKIVAGPASQVLASRIAGELGCELLLSEFRVFPDGELYTRVHGEISGDVTIVQSTPTNTDLIHLMQLIDACDKAKRIDVVIPYFGYARQDKRFLSGEAVSSRAVAKAISADHVYTVNIHDENVLGYFNCTASDLNAAPAIGSKIKSLNLKSPIIIAPDEGAMNLVSSVSGDDFDYDVLQKHRISASEVEIKPKKLDISGKDVVIVDDIISTGGTIAEATKRLQEQNPGGRIYVACVHPVFVGNAVLRLMNSGVSEVFATDTIEHILGCTTVAGIIAAEFKE